MTVFLDSDIVIYLVEGTSPWGPKADARVAALRAANTGLAVSDLVRIECRVGPLKSGNAARLRDFDLFFGTVTVFAVTAAVHGFKPVDSLNLATAVVNRCDLFLTHDAQLRRFPDITVEVLS